MLSENYLSGYDCMDVVKDQAGYNYYGFTRSEGTWRILREKTDGLEYRLAIGNSDYATNFAARATLTYKLSNQLPRL
jgi:hypothetical protein